MPGPSSQGPVSIAGHAAAQSAGLDLAQLEADVQSYFEHGLTPSTRRTYALAKRRYATFCQSASLASLPLSEGTLCKYVAYLAKQDLKHQSIKCYLSALRHLQIEAGLGDPYAPGAFPRLEYVLKGVKQTPSGQARPARLPITPVILRGLKSVWQRRASDPDTVMLWAACCLGFFGFMRAGEFTVNSTQAFDPTVHLTAADISVNRHQSPSLLCVRLKQSKTDLFRVGVSLFLGRTGRDICPVTAVLAYQAIRLTSQGPLFVFRDGSYLTRDSWWRSYGQASDLWVSIHLDLAGTVSESERQQQRHKSGSSWPKSNGERPCMIWMLICA